MLPFFEMLQDILQKPLKDINDVIADYNDTIIYELDSLVKQTTITQTKNQYIATINLLYITKNTDINHNNNALKILNNLESYSAKVIQKVTFSQLIIINATKYLVTNYELSFNYPS